MAWPLIIANSFWNLQMTIDRVFLGQYSTAALGASVAVMSLFWTPMALLQQTSAYVTTFVAQYLGSGREERVGPSFWKSMYVSVFGGLLFLLLIPMGPIFFSSMGHSELMVQLEADYFAAVCFSALPMSVVASVSGLFTGVGRTQIIMVINFVGLLANVLLDYVLIFGNWGFPALGITGAGYATSLASLASAIFGLAYLFSRSKNKEWNLAGGWKWDSSFFLRYLKFGIPSGLQWALEGLSFAVFLFLLGAMPNGDAALSASSVAVTVLLLAILPPIGIGQAVSALVGQHLGNNEPLKAEQDAWAGFQMAIIYIVLVAASIVTFPDFYLDWFANSSDPKLWAETVQMAKVMFWFLALFCIFDSFNFVMTFALKGAGDTRFVFLVALIVPWPFMVLPTWLVRDSVDGWFWGWVGVTTYVIIQGTIFLFRFLGGKWKTMRVTESQLDPVEGT